MRNKTDEPQAWDKGDSTKKMLARLRRKVAQEGGLLEAAIKWGVPYQHISSAMTGAKLPPKKLLEAIGYRAIREIRYRYEDIEK